MDSVALWMNDDSNYEERLQRRIIRDHSNVMAISDRSFVKNFRLNKEAFMYVLRSITNDLKVCRRSTAIPPVIKLAATLKFLGQGGYQQQIGQDRFVGIAQQTMSSCLFEICDHELTIRSVNGRFGGASHDSHVWNLSRQRQNLKEKFDNGYRGTWILGYPLEPWLLTPYRNTGENSAESLFDESSVKQGPSLNAFSEY